MSDPARDGITSAGFSERTLEEERRSTETPVDA
jgi:hypothetical protein